ncbi:hypothetical protein TomTYG45_09410 [Sphingobium sp. TomTYG45]
MGTDKGLLDLLKLVEVATAGAGRVYESVDAFPEHYRHFGSKLHTTACLAVYLIRNAFQKLVIRMPWNY